MARIILHDTRLNGTVEPGLGRVITVDETTPLARGLANAVGAATTSPVELVIACHGFMTHSYGGASNVELRGGRGLQLCRESLRIRNISAVSVVSGYFAKIWLMACGPAGDLVHDSRPFCREFAYHANTIVVASDTAQRYHPGTHDNAAQVSREVLRFGNWEGNVYEFHPDGTVHDTGNTTTPLR